jgi:CBS domain containing-hemolysin-like protein
MPVFGESLDEIIGMIHVKDVFTIVAGMLLSNKPAPKDWTLTII